MLNVKTTPVKGTNDIGPFDMEIMEFVLDKIRHIYKNNGFLQIQTPILENLDLLTSGDSGDNPKNMFKTIKRGAKLDLSKENLQERDIVEEGLRYDLTVPLSRFYAGNLDSLPKPFKVLQIGESFRAENPQKGRSREFTQCDIDIFGESENIAEIDLIISAMQVYNEIGVKPITFKINDRMILNQIFSFVGFNNEEISDVLIVVDKIDKIGLNGVYEELIKLNFDKQKVDKLVNALCDIKEKGINECLNYGVEKNTIYNLQEIINCVNKFAPADFKIIFDISIVRGQGYYTGTILEAYYECNTFSRAIGGGGRYDKMLYKFLGYDVPAVGYSIGLVPCLTLIKEYNLLKNYKKNKIALLYNKDVDKSALFNKKKELMTDFDVTVMPEPKNYKDTMLKLKKLGYNSIYKMYDNKLITFDD